MRPVIQLPSESQKASPIPLLSVVGDATPLMLPSDYCWYRRKICRIQNTEVHGILRRMTRNKRGVFLTTTTPKEIWPSSCREEALEYLKRCDTIIRKILKSLMGGLNVKVIDEEKDQLLMGSKRINFNYYPKCSNPELSVGVGRHSDISTITVLLQDDIGRLYGKKLETNDWIHVPPVNRALEINIGDTLQRMSNDKYKSVDHRVIANGSKNRVSVPIFLHPKPTSVIGPLQELLVNGEKPIYKQILYADYTNIFFSKGHDGKDTIEFAKI
ncbi:feruloyl CoA ortho-hydroxylase F6H1-1-like [Lycium barbarum]|uniref:feruloyl CoA ortho-hydroxylase F6H1-1-like n=1 Tax=Lycium barbarum TaxID=112863 RepID=UPI00293F3FDE|nr:feruloyl CoA ortho-hydroxylase F6H1-1-like [Lycium barbarum]